MSKYAQFEYRCRRCGKVFSGIETSENLASQKLTEAMLGVSLGGGIQVKMLSQHFDCINKGEFGIGDLIGCSILEATS